MEVQLISQKKEDTSNAYWLHIREKDNTKHSLYFDDFADAKKMYDKILKSKSVFYKDIITYSSFEKELYDKWKKEGNIGKEGYPKLSDNYKIAETVYGRDDSTYEEKHF